MKHELKIIQSECVRQNKVTEKVQLSQCVLARRFSQLVCVQVMF